MVFSSIAFLFFYLPICIGVYRLVPLKLRNLVLLVFSLFFYGWGEPVYIIIMFISIGIDYTHGMLVEKFRSEPKKAKAVVASSVFCNLALLFFFKYFDFFAANLSRIPGISIATLGLELPIGISFYTFQTMSYTIDVYRQDARVQKNIITFGTYVTMFPQLIAGPIINYKSVAEQLEYRDQGVEKFSSGVEIFVIGLCKKVLLANSIGKLWDTIAATEPAMLSATSAWLGLLAFGLQIYFDFSGYSDMAIGLGRMFGFELMKNFDHPYESRSISEFWRRWHISLTNWFREYVYIPLGGNRKGTGRTIFNLTVVWTLTGIWHGASWNFLLWGIYFLIFIILERFVFRGIIQKIPIWMQHGYTLLVVFLGWGLFAIENLGQLGQYGKALFGAGAGLYNAQAGYYLRSYGLLLLILAVSATSLGKRCWKAMPRKQLVTPILLLLGLILCTACLVDATYNPFLYFRF